MAGTIGQLIVDGHVHFYPCYSLPVALRCLSDNLQRLASRIDPERPAMRVGLLAESRSHRFYRDCCDGRYPHSLGEWTIAPGPEDGTLLCRRNGQVEITLIAGRQIVTAERLEILALTVDVDIQDGCPVQDVLAAITAANGIPVINWAPGKWFFQRGTLVRTLIDHATPGTLWLGDTCLRPRLWPTPKLMQYGRERGISILAGSDPLPFPGEERWLGQYAFRGSGPCDSARIVSEARRILRGRPESMQLVGRRGGVLTTIRRLWQLKALKSR